MDCLGVEYENSVRTAFAEPDAFMLSRAPLILNRDKDYRIMANVKVLEEQFLANVVHKRELAILTWRVVHGPPSITAPSLNEGSSFFHR